jgi:hypothetical protein
MTISPRLWLDSVETARRFMKLRIKGDSLRLRVSRSELARLLQGDRIEETAHFAAAPEARLTYALESAIDSAPVRVEYGSRGLTVILSEEQLGIWGLEKEVGVYSTLDIGGDRSLEVIVEKDFSCLDREGEENDDTFRNPHEGVAC